MSYHPVSRAFLDMLYAWRRATNVGDLQAIGETYDHLTGYVAALEQAVSREGTETPSIPTDQHHHHSAPTLNPAPHAPPPDPEAS